MEIEKLIQKIKDFAINDSRKDSLSPELLNSIAFAEELVRRLDFEFELELSSGEDDLFVFPGDEQYSNYKIKVLNRKSNELFPCVVDSDMDMHYEYKEKKDEYPIDAYVALLEYVTIGIKNEYLKESAEIIILLDDNQRPASEIKQPITKLTELVKLAIPDKKDYSAYYEIGTKTIKHIFPYRILKDSDRDDMFFEMDLRRIVISLAKGKTVKQLRNLLKTYEEEELISDDDRKRSYDYNSWLINDCVEFEENNCREEGKTEDERRILGYVVNVLIESGYTDAKASIDDRGIIRYTAKKEKTITGYIGQVFLPEDKSKLIRTKYLADETNYWFVPEYRAFLEKRTDASDERSLEERTILTTYIQRIQNLIGKRIKKDICYFADPRINVLKNTTVINKIYKELYEERFKYDFLAEECDKKDTALPYEIRKDIVDTLAGKVKYDNYIRDELYPVETLVHEEENEFFNKGDYINLIDGTKGYFDPEATSSGKDQGLVRYMVSGTAVGKDGRIIPAENRRAPIFENDFLGKYSKYNPFDRNQMVFSNLMRAYSITEPVGTALMTCGGWNMEDGFVVSKKFADNYKVPDAKTGELRPLKAGDKMLDRGGNKGVISIVVDPDDINDDGLSQLRKIFSENEDLQVIASPYSGLSRFNGATARELMEESEDKLFPMDLKEDGKTIFKKSIGRARFIITKQFADKKTKIYDDEEYEEGKSRKASAQLAWALCSKDAKEMLRHFYKDADMSKNDLNDFVSLASVWFSEKLSIRDFDKLDVESDRRFILKLRESGDTEVEKILNTKEGICLYLFDTTSILIRLYVLPKHLRQGYVDGTGKTVESKVTRIYRNILMSSSVEEADKKLDILQNEIQNVFAGKENIFKTKLMTRLVDSNKSSTAIWTPDPRLSIEAIDISKEIADTLSVKEEDYLLIWRDPVLRDAGVRYMRVNKVRPYLTGIAINPVMAKGFDGDFDGDTVAVVKISDDIKAHNEAIHKFSVASNLIDEGKTNRPLFINTKLDLVSVDKFRQLKAENELKEINEELKNSYDEYQQIKDKDLFSDLNCKIDTIVKKIDKILQEVFAVDYYLDNAIIRLESEKEVLNSINKILKSEAKGNNSDNVERYKKYFYNEAKSEDMTEVQIATAIKSAVGVAGRYSQQLMRAFREICPKAALELTYPNTQALLQIKHDPSKAIEVYSLLEEELMVAWDMKKEGRIEQICEVYKELNQPIGEDGICKKYLEKIDEELGDKGLYKFRGSILDELSYNNYLFKDAKKSGAGRFIPSSIKNIQRALLDLFFRKYFADGRRIEKSIVIAAVNNNGLALELASDEYKKDKDIVLAAVNNNGLALKYTNRFNKDKTIVLAAIKSIGNELEEASEEQKKDDVFVLQNLSKLNEVLGYVSERLRNDKSFIDRVVDEGFRFDLISDSLKNDSIFVQKAVSQNGLFLKFVPSCQNDPVIVKTAVSNQGYALKYASENLRRDSDIVLAALSQNGLALEYASEESINDKKIVLYAVSRNGLALENASEELRKDKIVVLTAVANNGLALEFALGDLKDEKIVVLAAVANNGMALRHAPEKLKKDRSIVLVAVSQKGTGKAFEFASSELREDEDFVLEVLSIYGWANKYTEKLNKRKEFIKKAVAISENALQYASDEVKTDTAFVVECLNINKKVYRHIPDRMKKEVENSYDDSSKKDSTTVGSIIKDKKERALVTVAQEGWLLDDLSEENKNDEEVVLVAVSNSGYALKYASENIKKNREVVLVAICNDVSALQYASNELSDTDHVFDIISNITNVPKFSLDDTKMNKDILLESWSKNLHCKIYCEKEYDTNTNLYTCLLQDASEEIKNNEDIVLTAIARNSMELEFASEYLKGKKEVVLAAVSKNGRALKFANEKLKNNPEIVKKAVENDPLALEFASDGLKGDKEIVLIAAAANRTAFIWNYVSDKLRDDRDFILEAVSKNDSALAFASDELKNDQMIVKTAVARYGFAFRYASKELKDNKDFIIDEIVSKDGFALACVSDRLRQDRDVVIAAIKNQPDALQYALGDCKNDKDVVILAVSKSKNCLEFASNLANDKDIIRAAVMHDPSNLQLKMAVQKLNDDSEVAMRIVKREGDMLISFSDDIQNNKDIVKAAVSQNGDVLADVIEAYKNDKEIVMAAVGNYGLALAHASKLLKDDNAVVKTAILNDSDAIQFASERIKTDKDFVKDAVSINGLALHHVHDDLKKNEEIVKVAVNQNGLALEFAHDDLKKNEEIVKAAIQNHGLALQHASTELKNNSNIVLLAFSKRFDSLEFASDNLRNDSALMLNAVKINVKALDYASDELLNNPKFMLDAVEICLEALDYASENLKSNLEFMCEAVSKNGLALVYAAKDGYSDYFIYDHKMFRPSIDKYANR